MPAEEKKLSPCPFCGGKSVFRHTGGSTLTDMVYVECLSCECVTKYQLTEAGAAIIWNRRAGVPVSQANNALNSDVMFYGGGARVRRSNRR